MDATGRRKQSQDYKRAHCGDAVPVVRRDFLAEDDSQGAFYDERSQDKGNVNDWRESQFPKRAPRTTLPHDMRWDGLFGGYHRDIKPWTSSSPEEVPNAQGGNDGPGRGTSNDGHAPIIGKAERSTRGQHDGNGGPRLRPHTGISPVASVPLLRLIPRTGPRSAATAEEALDVSRFQDATQETFWETYRADPSNRCGAHKVLEDRTQ